jgi:hypothetical protein
MSFFGDLERFIAEVIFPWRLPLGVGLAVALVAFVLVAWRRRWDRPLRRHPRRTAAVLVPLLAVMLPVGWYLASALIIRTELVEAEPITASETADPATAASVLQAGEFEGADDFHFGEGRAAIVETVDGLVLRFEDFSVLNGPDLHVYLSPDPNGYADGSIDLGALKATDGTSATSCPTTLTSRPWRAS